MLKMKIEDQETQEKSEWVYSCVFNENIYACSLGGGLASAITTLFKEIDGLGKTEERPNPFVSLRYLSIKK